MFNAITGSETAKAKEPHGEGTRITIEGSSMRLALAGLFGGWQRFVRYRPPPSDACIIGRWLFWARKLLFIIITVFTSQLPNRFNTLLQALRSSSHDMISQIVRHLVIASVCASTLTVGAFALSTDPASGAQVQAPATGAAPRATATDLAPSTKAQAHAAGTMPPATATGPDAELASFANAPIADWTARLDRAGTAIAVPNLGDGQLSQIRDDLESINNEVVYWLSQVSPKYDSLKRDLLVLGKAPAEGASPEAPALAAQRTVLNTRIATLSAPLTQVNLLQDRTTGLIAQVSALRRDRFASRVLARGQSPLAPSVWQLALPQAYAISTSMIASIRSSVNSQQFLDRLSRSLILILAALLVSVVLVWPVRRWVLTRYGRTTAVVQPAFITSLRATLVVGTTLAVLPTLAAGLVYLAAYRSELLTETGARTAFALFEGIVVFTWTVAFFRASLSPMKPKWRLLPVSNIIARGAWGTVICLALTFAVDVLLSRVVVIYSARLAVTTLLNFGFSLIVGALLLGLLLRQRMWMPDVIEPGAKPALRWIRLLLAFGVIGVLIAGAFGYVALARFFLTQLVLTSAVLVVFLIVHRLGSEFIHYALSGESWIGEWARHSLDLDDEGIDRASFWGGLLYGSVLGLVGLVVLLFIWGADKEDLKNWTYNLLFGLQIGNIKISLVSAAIALALFAGLLILTRFVQRLLADKILRQTRLDPSVRNSIRTGIGYAGVVLAGLVSFSAVGLDLSNLAIVAGALSVGIGFGMQNVVNNFVSGLILLVERPVKVGDWVVVGSNQGYVKRIKVRATEIQTFDRASVFIPNSMLISDAVTNWTYADKLGRIIIPIGVAYGSPARTVIETLLEIGRAHPEVMTDPAPSAAFRGFGDSALNFELRCFLQDVNRSIGVTSDLCVSIDERFGELGIEIPFPQRDVHLRSPKDTKGS